MGRTSVKTISNAFKTTTAGDKTVAAVYDRRWALIEGVNELPGQGVPLLEQEGWLRQ